MPKRVSTVCVSVRVSGYNKHHDQSNLVRKWFVWLTFPYRQPFISGKVRAEAQSSKLKAGTVEGCLLLRSGLPTGSVHQPLLTHLSRDRDF